MNYSADVISKLKSKAIGLSDLQNLPNWYPQLLLLNGDTANPGSYSIYVEANTFAIEPTLNLAQSQNMREGKTSPIGTNGTLLAVTQAGAASTINLGLTFSATPTGFMPQRSVTQFSDGSSNYFSGEALRIYLAQHGISYGGNSTGDFNFSQSNFGAVLS